MGGDQEKKRKSIGFSLSVSNEMIKLLDILSEDDDDNFLVASDLKNDKGSLRLPPLCVESSRPSLAWDAAFFNSSGFLDQHELSIINQGFRTQESTCNTLKKVDSCTGSHKKSSRKEAPGFSPNPAKALCRLRNSLMKPNKKDLVGKHDFKTGKTHTTPNSARFSYSSSGSCPSHLKRMEQSRKSEIMSEIWRCSERTKLVPHSSHLSTGLDSKKIYEKKPIVMEHDDAEVAPNPLPETWDVFSSAAQFRPSGIRPPSPKLGFFDEKTPLFPSGEPRTRRNTPRQVESQGTPSDAKAQFRRSTTDILAADSACGKLKRSIKRLRAAHMNPPTATNIKETSSIKKRIEDATRKLSKYDPLSSQENRKKACTDSGDICRYFEAIDLKDKELPSSRPSNKLRTPLAEKPPSILDYSNSNLLCFRAK